MTTTIQIKSRISGDVLFEHTAEGNAIKLTLEAAVAAGADLSGADLRGADLRRANLRDAYLYGADLRDANLSYAYMYGADLSDADMRRANLHGANLYGADLPGAGLSYANLHGANLYSADLRDADLRGANLSNAYLREGIKAVGLRPLLQIEPIGSREATLMIWVTNCGLRIEAGCFFGTRDKFERRVEEHHGDNIHAKEYAAALMLADIHFELWKPTEEEIEEAEKEESQS